MQCLVETYVPEVVTPSANGRASAWPMKYGRQERAGAFTRCVRKMLTSIIYQFIQGLFFCSSNLRTGSLFRFSRGDTADYRLGLHRDPDLDLATAVAASAAFPPVLSPLRLDLSRFNFVKATDGRALKDLSKRSVVDCKRDKAFCARFLKISFVRNWPAKRDRASQLRYCALRSFSAPACDRRNLAELTQRLDALSARTISLSVANQLSSDIGLGLR